MSAVPQKVLSWLHGVLKTEYRNVDRTYSDVAQALSYYPAFSLQTDVYTSETGGSTLLLNLRGTLPVSFRGTTYAFPISIWVPQEYPSAAPINFVTPIKDMAVRPGQYVSVEGRIYHPYLAGWREDRSSISELLSILQDVFAREPPVIAKQRQPASQTPQSQRIGAPPPIPPLPPELGRSDTKVRESWSPVNQNPPLPPPKQLQASSQLNSQADGPPPLPPHPHHADARNGTAQQYLPDRHARAPLSVPQYGPQRASNLQDENPPARQGNQNQRYSSHLPQEPISPSGPRWATQQNGVSLESVDGQHPPQWWARSSAHYPQYAPPPSHRNDSRQPTYPPHSQQALQQVYPMGPYPVQQIPQSQPPKPKPPEDLLTSPSDTTLPTQPTNITPPPIPPNPQKDALLSALSQTLTQQIQYIHASNMSAIPPLRTQQAALSSTLSAVNKEIAQLDSLETILSSNETILHQAMRDADKVLEDAKKRKVPSVDEVLVAPTVVAGQLYEAVAEERAIEECRGVLGRALDKGRINGGVWARQTRSLAREEFLKKALIKKISRGLGLVEDERWE